MQRTPKDTSKRRRKNTEEYTETYANNIEEEHST